MKNRPIGIFDSGVGGLTVFAQIERFLPGEDLVYFGDTARVPYGNKSPATIIKFSAENIRFLLTKKVKAVVVACNTSSALALDYLKEAFTVPILGVIEAGASKALAVSSRGKIGVIGTRSTIASASYDKKLLAAGRAVKVYSRSCPLFVPLVEEGLLSGKITQDVVRMYLQTLKTKGVDTLILGCTHYPLLKKEIARYLKDTFIVDSAREVAVHTRALLEKSGLLNSAAAGGRRKFYVSDEPQGFAKLARLFLKRDIVKPQVVNV